MAKTLPVSLMCIAEDSTARNYRLRPSNLICIWIWKELRKETAAQLRSTLQRFGHVCRFCEKPDLNVEKCPFPARAPLTPLLLESLPLLVCSLLLEFLPQSSSSAVRVGTGSKSLTQHFSSPAEFFSDVWSCRCTKYIPAGKTKFVSGSWTGILTWDREGTVLTNEGLC